jgi:hypothetical protein
VSAPGNRKARTPVFPYVLLALVLALIWLPVLGGVLAWPG